jgi:hypothetical protein
MLCHAALWRTPLQLIYYIHNMGLKMGCYWEKKKQKNPPNPKNPKENKVSS